MLFVGSQQSKLNEEKVQMNNVQMNTKDKVIQSNFVKVKKAITRVGILVEKAIIRVGILIWSIAVIQKFLPKYVTIFGF